MVASWQQVVKKKLNLTVDPTIRALAEAMAYRRRRSLSQLFEDLVEAEWESRKSSSLTLVKDEALAYGQRRRGRTP